MDYWHATARVQFPVGTVYLSSLASRPSQGTVNGGAVSKWPRCRWDVKHNQPTNQPCKWRTRMWCSSFSSAQISQIGQALQSSTCQSCDDITEDDLYEVPLEKQVDTPLIQTDGTSDDGRLDGNITWFTFLSLILFSKYYETNL